MKLTTSIKRAALAMSVAFGVASTGCSRDHIEAVNLANEGDRAVTVNVEGAIQKYEQARQLDPTNHLITWKLAKAYERKEDWDKMAATLAVAVQTNPEFASYWEKRGLALTKLAEAGNPDKWEEAKEPLKKFIEAGAKANIKRWNQAVELTACRAGLVLCADLEIAKKIISQEQQLPGDLPVADKLKELLLFAVSEEYSAIRKALGVAVNA